MIRSGASDKESKRVSDRCASLIVARTIQYIWTRFAFSGPIMLAFCIFFSSNAHKEVFHWRSPDKKLNNLYDYPYTNRVGF